MTDAELTRALAGVMGWRIYTEEVGMTTEPELMAYVAIAACGCIKLATVDTPERTETNAREIAACVKAGYRIERMTCAWVHEHYHSKCAVCAPVAQRKMEL